MSLVSAMVPDAFGNCITLSPPVASGAVSLISLASAVVPSNAMLPAPISIELPPSSVPAIKVVEANDVKPSIVEAVAPSATLVLPTVNEELAN